MRTLRSNQPLPPIDPRSIFLAGPTPRVVTVPSWRRDAIDWLEHENFHGDVIIPEPFARDYNDQVSWEHTALQASGVVLFWVPRDLETLPGFTTNVEFGCYLESGRMVYGRPANAPKNRYLDWHYERVYSRPPAESLTATLQQAIQQLG